MFPWMQSLLTSAQPYLHSQTFWTGVAALGGIGALLVITRQIYDARRLAAFELLRTEFDHFESNELLRVRSDVARTLLAKTNVKAMDESGCTIATQFERLGFLCKGGLLPPDFIWELFSQGTIQYWHVLREYIEQVRRGDDTVFEDFGYLYRRIAAVEQKRTKRRSCVPTKDEQYDFLRTELNVHYRTFSFDDLSGLKAIEVASFGAKAYKLDDLVSLNANEPESCIVADRLGDIVGYVLGQWSGKHAQIVSVAVDPLYRSLCIGDKLVRTALKRFENAGAEDCYVFSARDNPALDYFKQKFSFTEVSSGPPDFKLVSRDRTATVTLRVSLGTQKKPPEQPPDRAIAKVLDSTMRG